MVKRPAMPKPVLGGALATPSDKEIAPSIPPDLVDTFKSLWSHILLSRRNHHRVGRKLRATLLLAMGLGFTNECLMTSTSVAQVIPNGLGTTVDAQACSSSCTITGGQTRGANVFHSFEEFSIPRNGIATFQHDEAIANIITRVTGDSTSRINGTLQTLVDGTTDDVGTADFFFINPNGIVFGANAELNIGGSFVGSTAETLQFEDGTEFSVSDANPLLTISVPTGLQFGTDPGNIRVVGEGNGLFLNPDATVNRSDRPTGISVPAGNTLALVGGQIKLNGGNLTADSGRIELGAVVGSSLVEISEATGNWELDYGMVETFGNLELVNAASVDVSGEDAGAVKLQGKTITMQDGSSVLANTLAEGGGDIRILATESLSMSGTSATTPEVPFSPMPTSAYIEISPGAVGDGSSELLVQTTQLNLDGGAQIGLSMGGLGTSGVVNIQAETIQANSGSPTAFSGIFTAVLPVFPAPPDFTSPPPASGLGGDLNIETDTLEVLNGAQIVASTFGLGDAGNFTITAQDINVIGFNSGGASSLRATSEIPPAGNGGNLIINTDRLIVADGGQVTTATVSETQAAGDLTIRATDSIELRGIAPLGRSGLFASAFSARNPETGDVFEAAGEGGSINIETDRLTITDEASINVSNNTSNLDSPLAAPGIGPAGNIAITADTIVLSDQASLTADTVDGDRANISLISDLIVLSDQSQITTNATGTATGGDLTFDTLTLAAFRNSDITANAIENQGGNIQIRAQGVFGIQPREELTPFNDITASSEFGLDGTIVIESPDVDPEEGLVELPSQVVDVAQLIAQECRQDDALAYSQLSIIGRGGIPSQPSGFLNRRAILASPNPPIDVSEAAQTSSTAIATASPTVIDSPLSPIETSSTITEARGWSVAANGQVALNTQATAAHTDGALQPGMSCRGR